MKKKTSDDPYYKCISAFGNLCYEENGASDGVNKILYGTPSDVFKLSDVFVN